MDTLTDREIPVAAKSIYTESKALDFSMISEPLTGALLRALAASKPGGRFLELGTGTGAATAWLLDGMDAASSLVSVDHDTPLQAVARRHLGHDRRVTFVTADAESFLDDLPDQRFDFIFADTWAGKYLQLERTLALLPVGGIYAIDDMLPQKNWPEGHEEKVRHLLNALATDRRIHIAKLSWASGIVIAVRMAEPRGTTASVDSRDAR
jgi:predicted O-methyltransferase YrrM